MTEDQLEHEGLGWLAEVGYATAYGPDLAPDGASPERADYRQVVLVERLRRSSTVQPQKTRFSVMRPSKHAGLRPDFEKRLWWHVCNF